VRTKRAYGLVTVATAFVIAACGSNNPAETVYTSDGGTLEDTGAVKTDAKAPSYDTGTGFNTPDTGSTFIDTGTVGTPDTGTVGTPDVVQPTGDGGGGGVCPSTCTTDSECQAQCPAQAGALNCCDTVTSACFTSASSTCPDQMSTGGGDSGGGGY
jgi:hypothetical protein